MDSEGDRRAETQNRAHDVDDQQWMMLEETCKLIGKMIADNSNHYNEGELYDMIPDDLETFEWYRQQMLMHGEGVETHLVHAGHELAGLINQILETAMTQRVVLNGDMSGRRQILRKEILEAIDDCRTRDGCRRNFRCTKKLQRLEREATERAANSMEAAGNNDIEEVRDRRQRGQGHTTEEELANVEEAMFHILPEEGDAIPGDHSMAGLALLGEGDLQDVATRTTYAGNSPDRIRANLQDGEPPYFRKNDLLGRGRQ